MQTLLIVDDDPSIREVFSILLSAKGYSVLAASGGNDCIEQLKHVAPDLLLLDIMMHPVDGWETLTSIRNNPLTGQIPAVMFSGKTPSREEVICYGGWIEDYLMKPITMPTITRSLDDVFVRIRAETEVRQHYLKNGADLRLVNEYFQLKRFLFIRNKFSRELFKDAENIEPVVVHQKNRFDELSRILSFPGMNASGELEKTAGI